MGNTAVLFSDDRFLFMLLASIVCFVLLLLSFRHSIDLSTTTTKTTTKTESNRANMQTTMVCVEKNAEERRKNTSLLSEVAGN